MQRSWALITLAILSSGFLVAQPWRPYKSRAILGSNSSIENLPANTVAIPEPLAMTFGRDGKTHFNSMPAGYFAIDDSGVIRRVAGSLVGLPFAIAANGTIYSVVGGALNLRFPDGRSLSVSPQFSGTLFTGIAIDSLGRVFAADQGGQRVFRLNDDGTFTIVAGIGSPGELPGAPNRIAVDANNRLVISLTSGQIIRMAPFSSAEVIAGKSESIGSSIVVAAGPDNIVYFRNTFQRNITRITPDGRLEVAVANSAPADIAVDGQGRLLVAESNPPQIWRLEKDGSRTRIAGLDPSLPLPGGTENLTLSNPFAIAVDMEGSLFVCDTNQNRILKRRQDGTVTTLATGIRQPARIGLGGDGSVYVTGLPGRSVLRISESGVVNSFAGTGDSGDDGDGRPATEARFRDIRAILPTRLGIALLDSGNNRIRVVESNGIIQNLAGNGRLAPVEEGSVAKLSAIGSPASMAVDKQGSLVFFDSTGLLFRRISAEGIVTSLPFAVPGDAQAADRCRLDRSISGMAFDSTNSIVFAGRGSLCRIDPNGTPWLVNGEFHNVSGVAIDAEDRIYISDTWLNQVYMLEPSNFTAPYSIIPKVNAVIGAAGSQAPSVVMGSPGALMTVYGSGFTSAGVARAVDSSDLVNGALPTKLANTCLEYDRRRVPLTYVSATQINFQLPNPPYSSNTLRVASNCEDAQEFKTVGQFVEIRNASPEFLYWTKTGSTRSPVVAVDASTSAFIGAENLIPGQSFRPARPGDLLTIYCISLGLTNPQLAPGQPASGPAPLIAPIQVLINDIVVPASDVLYAGASPGTAGLYQINLRVPNLPDGDHPIRILVNTTSSPTDGYLTIRR
jgi:uncharacterized protein (TIGR03437 family)